MQTALAATLSTVVALMLALNARADEPMLACPSFKCTESKVFTPVTPTSASGTNATQYVIKCELTRVDAEGRPQPLAAPNIMVSEGQAGNVSIGGDRPVVVAMRTNGEGSQEPIVATMTEGVAGTFKVTALNDDRVIVDAEVRVSTIERVETVPATEAGESETASTQLTTTGWRVVRAARIGESLEVVKQPQGEGTSAKFVANLTVHRLGVDEAAITPIGATEPEEAADTQLVWNTYNVVDLLEAETQIKALDKLTDVDFVPVVDMVLSEAAVGWPEEAEIRPDPEHGHLHINQTQEAHEKIGRVLRDQRDNMAAVKRLIR